MNDAVLPWAQVSRTARPLLPAASAHCCLYTGEGETMRLLSYVQYVLRRTTSDLRFSSVESHRLLCQSMVQKQTLVGCALPHNDRRLCRGRHGSHTVYPYSHQYSRSAVPDLALVLKVCLFVFTSSQQLTLTLSCDQYLESYHTVSLPSMAEAFGLRVEMLDRELSDLVACGRLR